MTKLCCVSTLYLVHCLQLASLTCGESTTVHPKVEEVGARGGCSKVQAATP